jgi:type III restriction enzyme
MKFKFKVQPYQTDAVEAVVECFAGQPYQSGLTYRIDPGVRLKELTANVVQQELAYTTEGFKNAELLLTDSQLLTNIHTLQRNQNLNLSDKLVSAYG